MSSAENNPPIETDTSAAVVSELDKLRKMQLAVLAGAILLDLALLVLGVYLLFKKGIVLEASSLFTTGLIFVFLSGVGPAVALSTLWPKGGEHSFVGMRRTQYGYNVVFGCRLLFGLLVVLNVILFKYGPRHFDWTSDKVFTLNSVSVKQVQALEKPVKLIALYPRLSQPGQQLDTLFTLYEDASKMVSHEFVDRFEDKIKTDDVFKEYPDAKQAEPVVIVTYGAGDNPEHKVIRHADIFPPSTVDARSMSEVKTEFKGEDAFTSAIGQLTQAQKNSIYFSTGHGELDINDSDRRKEEGIGLIKERMEAQNMKVDAVNLAQKEIPKDASLLVIAGPKTPFFPEEVQKVKDYLSGGGRLIAMIDPGPEMREEATTGLEPLLAEYNVRVKDNLVIDLAANFRSPARLLVPVGETRTSHSIVEDLKGEQILMEQVREVAPLMPTPPPGQPGGAPASPFKTDTLLSTRDGSLVSGDPVSWGESSYKSRDRKVKFDEGEDSKGPISLALAVSKNEGAGPDPHAGMMGGPPPQQKSTPVMVVFGDSSFAANNWVSQVPTNRDLFLNSVNWLRGRLELVGIQPRTKKSLVLTVNSGQFWRMVLGPAGIMAGFLIASALSVWIVRNRF